MIREGALITSPPIFLIRSWKGDEKSSWLFGGSCRLMYPRDMRGLEVEPETISIRLLTGKPKIKNSSLFTQSFPHKAAKRL